MAGGAIDILLDLITKDCGNLLQSQAFRVWVKEEAEDRKEISWDDEAQVELPCDLLEGGRRDL